MLMDASVVVIPLLKQKTDILHPDNISHLNGFASIWCSIENIFLASTGLLNPDSGSIQILGNDMAVMLSHKIEHMEVD